MADIFEYSEVRWPSRTEDQEEEERALSSSKSILMPPELLWSESSRSCESLKPSLLIICASPASTSLFQQACTDRKLAASISFPESFSEELTAAFPSPDQACSLYALHASATILSIDCSHRFPPERANVWTQTVLGALQPKQVLILGSLKAELYRGEGDASQETLVYLLETEAARQLRKGEAAQVQYLPTGTVVPGLPAAVLSWCQLRGVPAQLVLTVDMVAGLLPHSIPPLSATASKLLKQAGVTDLASQLAQPKVVTAAQQAVAGGVEISAMYS